MIMAYYNRQYTFNTKYKKTKKLIVALCVVLVLCFVIISVIGLIANSDSIQSNNINNAILENTQLKYTIEEQNEKIAELNAQIDSLKMQLENGAQLQEEEPYQPNQEQDDGQTPQAFNNNPTTPRDEIEN